MNFWNFDSVKWVSSVASLLAILGCGGGGADGGTTAPQTPVVVDPNLTVPLQTAVARVAGLGLDKAFTLSGWVDHSTANNPVPRTPITGSGRYTLSPGQSGWTFNSNAILLATVVVTGTATAAGQATPVASTGEVYYSPSDFTIVGQKSGTSVDIFVPYTVPLTVKAGDAGRWASSSLSVCLTCSIVTGSYVVSSDRLASLILTTVSTTTNFGGGGTQTQTDYRIDTSGGFELLSITIQSQLLGTVYKTLTFTF